MIKYRATCGECGFTSNLCRSRAQATYAGEQHSCDKQRARDAAAARGAAVRAAVDRTPKPCLHKIARHEHGTHACFVLDRCKCPPCSAANAAYEKNRYRQAAYGRWHPYVDAGPAREHVRELMAAGVGLKRIVKVSGVSQGVLWKLVYGKRRADGTRIPSVRIRYETAVRLMVVHAGDPLASDTLAGGAFVDATGTHRRAQALVAIGYSQSKLAAHLGLHGTNFGKLLERTQVTAKTARAMAALYDQLWDQPPPERTHKDKIAASRSRNYAAAREWPLPIAWADVDIDDPAAHPNATGYDEDRVSAVMAGALVAGDEDLELALTRADRLEVLRRGRVVHRWPTAETARQTGLSPQQLYTDIGAARRHAAPGRSQPLPPADELQFLIDNGQTIAAIAARFNVSEDGVLTALRRATAA